VVGRTLGQYEILTPLGAGGMGEVYRARHSRLKRDVAIKLLPEDVAGDPERLARLQREAELLAALNHPNIAAIYNLDEHDGAHFLVLELIEGETLEARLARGALPVDEALDLCGQIAEALEAAHDAGIIHRDLKPANVIVTAAGRAKVLDFGIAKALGDGTAGASAAGGDRAATARPTALTGTGMILGTAPYISPEQVRGQPVDARTDIWAFGCILYESLSGKRAFERETVADTLAAIVERDPDWSLLPAGIPRAVQRLLERCLQRDLRRRLRHIGDAWVEIDEAQDGRPRQGRRRTYRRVGFSIPGRGLNRKTAALGALLVLLLSGGWWMLRPTGGIDQGGAAASRGSPADPAHRVAVLPFSYRGADTYAYLGEGMVDLLSRTLDGAGPLQTVDPRAVLGVLARQDTVAADAGGARPVHGVSLATARAVANTLGVGRFVVGEIVEAGGSLQIAARMYGTEEGGHEPASAEVEGLPDELFRLVEDLTAQLATAGGAAPGTQLGRTAAGTTANLDALKAFLQGEQFFRGGESQRDMAYAAFQRAVDLDPTFAIAWYRLSQLAYFSGLAVSRVSELAETAARHSAGLPWRARRLLEANWAYVRGVAVESERAYREILQTYPDDVDALFGAADLRLEYGWLLGAPMRSARQPVEEFLRYEPDDFIGLWNLRNVEAGDGNCAAAHSLNRKMYPLPRQIPPAHLAVAVFCGAPSDEQEELLRAARDWTLRQLRVAGNWANWIARNPRGAAALARLAERDEDPRSRAVTYLFLAEMELAQGREEAARAQFSRLESLNPAWALTDRVYRRLASHYQTDAEELRTLEASLLEWDAGMVAPWAPGGTLRQVRHDGVHLHLRSYLLGRISAKLGEHETALRHADELERMTTPPDAGSLALDLAQSIRAHVFAEQGRLEDALRALEAVPREVPFSRKHASWAFVQPQERFLRAELLSQLGRQEEALRWYQSGHYYPESVLAGPSHLRQAEIHDQLGRPEQAIEQYRRFVDLWRDADPEFRPLVESAQRTLQRLTNR